MHEQSVPLLRCFLPGDTAHQLLQPQWAKTVKNCSPYWMLAYTVSFFFLNTQQPAVRAGLHGEEPFCAFRERVRPAAGQVHDGGDGREHDRSGGGAEAEADVVVHSGCSSNSCCDTWCDVCIDDRLRRPRMPVAPKTHKTNPTLPSFHVRLPPPQNNEHHVNITTLAPARRAHRSRFSR